MMIPEVRETDETESGTPTRLLYPMPEAAQKLGGITERMLWTLVLRGDIESVRVGRRRMVPHEALTDYIAGLRSAA